ncbi:MAG: hypothetical protein IJ681_07230 [Bacteroidales bacterium]|nr:hypothetical protein [Bacteroidales bacterium]
MNGKLFIIRQYIIYKYNAKGAFSIHSPFVFELFNNVIKRKKHKKSLKKNALIENLNAYYTDFNILNLSLKVSYKEVADKIKNPFTILLFHDIHACKENFDSWKRFINMEENFISIDLFFIGLIINNPYVKQKQHYILRNSSL